MADIRINALATTATTPASDDYLALDGTAQGTRKILATNIANNVTDVILGTSGPSVKSSLSARAPRQGLVFDGTARASYSIPAFGTGDFSVSLWINQATLSNSAAISGPTNAFQLTLNRLGNGYLSVTNSGVAHVLDVNASAYIQVGKFQLISCVRSSGTVTFYVNGISVGSGAVATDFSAGCIYVGGAVSTAFVTGTIAPFIYNRALSASEVVALYEAGAPADGDFQTAGQKNSSSFATTVVPYTTFTGASATGFTAARASGTGYVMSGNDFTVRLGAGATKVRFSGTVTLNNGKTVNPFALLATNSGTTISNDITLGSGGAFSIVLTASVVASSIARVWVGSTGDADYTITNAKVEVLGLLLAPDAAQAGGGLVWYDTSGNAANITLPASGVSWNVPSSRYLGGNWTTSGTLTVSGGTITNSSSGDCVLDQTTSGSGNYSVLRLRNTGGTAQSYDVAVGGSGTGQPQRWYVYDNTAGATRLAIMPSTGNFLIGGTIDGGQKLQVSGTGYLSDSLRVGTSWSPLAWGVKAIEVNDAGGGLFAAYYNGTAKGYIVANSGDLAINTQGANSLLLRTNGNTALTLDSSQNATFAGRITVGAGTSAFNVGNSGQLTVASNGAATDTPLQISNTAQNWQVRLNGSNGALWFYNVTGGSVPLFLSTTGDATFAGTVIANKATTAFRIPTAETPASASATGTIGTITWDASYIYVCTAANTWKRVAIATWP